MKRCFKATSPDRGVAMTTTPVTSTPAASAPSDAAASSGSAGLSGLNQADFIKLLTAQLQNQDPTSPTKPQDLANEFAQLSTVSGITALNDKVTALSTNAGAAEIGQAANLIGKTVSVSGGAQVTANSSGQVVGGYSVAAPADQAEISIIDPSTGKVVHTISATNPQPGLNNFDWNGGAAGHGYTYTVRARAGASDIGTTTYTNAAVENVNLTGGTPTLTLAGATTPVDLSQIVSVFGG
ncbi:flagellar hook capping protein [Thioclava sp. BHET1]|nr:flagellar hook capping protein [Thioclava sp. BHET1]